MDKAFEKSFEYLSRARASLMDLKLSDYENIHHVNNALDALLCIDNAIKTLSYNKR